MSIHGSRKCSESSLQLELRRQIFHLVLISLWGIPVLFFPFPLTLMVFSAVLAVNLFVVLRVPFFLKLFNKLIELLEREKNLRFPGIQSLYANLGIFLAYLLFGKLSITGVAVLAVGDSKRGRDVWLSSSAPSESCIPSLICGHPF